MTTIGSSPLPRFVILYVALYAAFGVSSPFLPAFLASRGLEPQEIGLLLAAGTAVRLASGPLAGRLADRLQALRAVLAICTALAALVAIAYLPSHGFWALLTVSLLHAAALAPITTLADALALGAATPAAGAGRTAFEYGWVRGAGSAAFIVGAIISGQAVAALGLIAIVWLHAALLGAASSSAYLVPELIRGPSAASDGRTGGNAGVAELLRLPQFRRLVLVAALVLGSHAMHDAFAVIRWSAAGISPGTASVLWSESVAAEVVVFFFIGPPLVSRIGPAGAMAIAAAAGALRWIVMAQTTDVLALALMQPLHGLTFALLHLGCMRLLGEIVPPGLAATAQALYGTVGVGAASALLTFASGWLYARYGAQGFWAMAALCAIALPLTFSLRYRPCGRGAATLDR